MKQLLTYVPPTLFRLAVLVLVIAIICLSLEPSDTVDPMSQHDKLRHLGAYGLLTACALFGWPRTSPWVIIGLATCFGIGVELAQGLSGTGRTASFFDALANFAGAVLANLIVRFMLR